MTTPTNSSGEPEPMTLAEIRALLEQTAKTAAENTRAIVEMRAENAERATRHDKEMAEIRVSITETRAEQKERAAQHDREMAEIRALQVENTRAIGQLNAAQRQTAERLADLTEAINRLRGEQNRTSNDVSTLKGWALENLCERHPELFADRLELRSVEIVPTTTILEIANAAHQRGIITEEQRTRVISADVYFYGRRAFDDTPVCLLVQVSFAVKSRDVRRAFAQAGILREIIQQYQPRHVNGTVIPVVTGTEIDPDASDLADHLEVAYVPVNNGNQLTNPPE